MPIRPSGIAMKVFADNAPANGAVFQGPYGGQNLRVTVLAAGATAMLEGTYDDATQATQGAATWVSLGALRLGDNVMKCTFPRYRIVATGAGAVEVWQKELEV